MGFYEKDHIVRGNSDVAPDKTESGMVQVTKN